MSQADAPCTKTADCCSTKNTLRTPGAITLCNCLGFLDDGGVINGCSVLCPFIATDKVAERIRAMELVVDALRFDIEERIGRARVSVLQDWTLLQIGERAKRLYPSG